MHPTPPSSESLVPAMAARGAQQYIYMACPWAPLGGGMYRVAHYLIQSQAGQPAADAATLRPLDSRGGGSRAGSMWRLLIALAKILAGRLGGRLAGVHVNVAERLSLVRKGAIIAWSHLLGVPVVLHLHAQMEGFYGGLPAFAQALTRRVFGCADVVVVIGPAARRFVVEELGVPPERVEVVINGVPAATQPRRREVAGAVKQVLFLGNLDPHKGVPDLLAALARPEFDRAGIAVTIAGGGPLLARYREQALRLGLEDLVQFTGWCDQDQAAALLARADVLVLPSHKEVLPLVILEALANGVAVISTPVGEIPSVLTGGVHTLYVEPGDVAGLAAALQQVLHDAQLRRALEHNGHALYRQALSLPQFFAQIARVHQRAFGIAARPGEPAATEVKP
jgi:glycosyltransferase involved in cell wall biosynthesis